MESILQKMVDQKVAVAQGERIIAECRRSGQRQQGISHLHNTGDGGFRIQINS